MGRSASSSKDAQRQGSEQEEGAWAALAASAIATSAVAEALTLATEAVATAEAMAEATEEEEALAEVEGAEGVAEMGDSGMAQKEAGESELPSGMRFRSGENRKKCVVTLYFV